MMDDQLKALHGELGGAKDEIARLKRWVEDLQPGPLVTCPYCGRVYGPHDEVTERADMIIEHTQECHLHPMAELQRTLKRQKRIIAELQQVRDALQCENGRLRAQVSKHPPEGSR